MTVKVQIIFYSLYGHIYHMAQAVAEGAKSAGAQVEVMQVPELLSPEILAKIATGKIGDVTINPLVVAAFRLVLGARRRHRASARRIK